MDKDKEKIKLISKKVESAIKKKWAAQNNIQDLGKIIGDLVT